MTEHHLMRLLKTGGSCGSSRPEQLAMTMMHHLVSLVELKSDAVIVPEQLEREL